MKKTIIAAALAATTGVAVADVTVSGRVEQGFADEDNVSTGWDTYTDNHINFKATEDLGNGMTAFAQISSKYADGESDTITDLDQKIGLTGGFGTVVLGTMEDFTTGVVSATMTTMGTNEGELDGSTQRTNGGIAYVSPTVNGFHVGIAGYADVGSNTDEIDATDILIHYSNGPLTAMAAREVTEGSSSDVDSIALKYNMGDLSVAALRTSYETDSSDDMKYRLDYKMGANKVTLQHSNDDSANNDINIIELSHALSKRTAVYIGSADGDTAATSNTYFGMQHSF